ncbi:hypothetical protein B0H15DRAFT_914148 [Mycena belliarum]|uniref:Uncharacterized protein n=1 Tax=Mycena belliarum TaxID=1033014 RepID=A0AAD6TZ29_9AGAR|nr:hypothetical protein B0H15DRAFT_914148 [Mycena belliae]
MPESQVSNAKAHQIQNELSAEFKKTKVWPSARLVVFPRTFAVGTDTKSYATLSVDRGDYQDSQEPVDRTLSPWDQARIPANTDWAYVGKKQLEPGPAHVGVRGKCLVFTAGYHALVCHLGLEGNITPMDIEDFNLIVSECVPGPNKDPKKAAQMRSFVLPAKFREAAARSQDETTITVLGALLTALKAYVISDFNRITRLHVVSSARTFTKEDIAPRSSMWIERLWSMFPSGPDWVYELPEALANLDKWRVNVIKQSTADCIVDVLVTAHGPGGGIGKHLACDLLHQIGVLPDTSAFDLCSIPGMYNRLRAHLPVFMATWVSPKFLKACAGRTNSRNALAFNTTSNRNFLESYVDVYRRTKVRVPRDLYNLHLSLGNFDPTHIYGTPYLKPFELLTKEWKDMPVRCFSAPGSRRYHIILAQVPQGYPIRSEITNFSDVTNAGFSTTLGVASFKEPMQNKPDLHVAKALVRRGRPVKIHTGQVGRPRKELTLPKIKIMEREPRSKSVRKRSNQENEEPFGTGMGDDGLRRSKRLRLN